MDRKYILETPLKTARFTRLMAKAIDLFIALIITIFIYPIGVVLAIAYLAACDYVQDGQSVGKKVMGFRVISLEDGKPCSLRQSIVRNLPFIVPMLFTIIPYWGWVFASLIGVPLVILEVYLIFKLDSGHRLGDVMADTTVNADDPNRVDIKEKKDSWFQVEGTPTS